MSAERFLVTGAHGCVGAWVVHELLRDGAEVVTFDIAGDDYRLRYLLDGAALANVTRVRGDVSVPGAIGQVVRQQEITNVIHLAGLQVPACAADPPAGAMVNIVGTINVFEGVKGTSAADKPVAYSSSVAAYDASDDPQADPIEPTGRAGSHYGVYKFANEGSARVYARHDGVSSVGIRPHTVYGVGRDQGMTSTPTVAMLAAAAGEPFDITFAGACQMQHAADVARAFIAATRTPATGALVFNLDGAAVAITEVVKAIRAAAPEGGTRIGIVGEPLPFPAALPDDGIADVLGSNMTTSLELGVADTIERFRVLLAEGKVVSPSQARFGTPNAVRSNSV